MKLISNILLSGILLLTCHAWAQLPTDQNGKITYVEIIKDSIQTDSLSKWIGQWMGERYTQFPIEKDSNGSYFSTKGRFLVYVKEGIFKQIHGAIHYSVKVEIRENRYRYIFTGFVFEYYQQERADLLYHPNGKEKPLEEKEFKGSQKLWDRHKVTTDQHVKKMIASLKFFVATKKNPPKKEEAPKTTPVGNDW
jgi:hypothetical protein